MTPTALTASLALRLSALSGALAVGLGAFGAHALKDLLAANGREETWKTAVLYHLVHTVAMLALSLAPSWKAKPWLCFAAGNIVFAGSLYLLCLTQVRILGAITPIGGLAYIAGWLWLAFASSELKGK